MAAVAVVFSHTILGANSDFYFRILTSRFGELQGSYDKTAKIVMTVLNGHTAVIIFFVMSGAVLFESLQRRRKPALPLACHFLLARFFRLYPPLFVCVVSGWILFNLVGIPRSANQLLQNLLLYDFPVNGATWTLNTEAFAALLLIAAFLAYRLCGEIGVIAVAGVFGCLYLPPLDGYFGNFKMFIYSFTAGALIPTRLGRYVVGWMPKASWPFLLVAVFVASHTIQETFIALLVGMIYYHKAGGFGEMLASRLSVFLGTISFSLYLFNVPILEILSQYLRTFPTTAFWPIETGLVSGIVVVVLTIPVAILSVKWIEKPGIALGRKVARILKSSSSEMPHLDKVPRENLRPTS